MWKHTSTWETMAQMVVFPPQAWVLKREILWIPLVGWASLDAEVHRDRPRRRAPRRQPGARPGTRTARRRHLGARSFRKARAWPPGETRKYGMSGALLASQAGVKIVPVAHNAGDFWPRRGLAEEARPVRVVIGPPVEAAGRDRASSIAVQAGSRTMRELQAAPGRYSERLRPRAESYHAYSAVSLPLGRRQCIEPPMRRCPCAPPSVCRRASCRPRMNSASSRTAASPWLSTTPQCKHWFWPCKRRTARTATRIVMTWLSLNGHGFTFVP